MDHQNSSESFEYFATCPPGAEQLLAAELKGLRCRQVRPLGGGVSFFGMARDAERVCLWSRLAGNVTVTLARVGAADSDELYDAVRALDWGAVLGRDATIAVSAKGSNDQLRHSHFTALRVKDAICDALLERAGWRPSVDAQTPDAAIEVRLRGDKATISLNLSGASLHRRDYLDEHDGPDAPRTVAQAAALLALLDWDKLANKGGSLYDPSCNEGLLVCEAALMLCQCAPGISRSRWGFLGWAQHDADAWDQMLSEADERFEEGLAAAEARLRVLGTSNSSPSIARARVHAKRAGVSKAVSVELYDDEAVDDGSLFVRLCPEGEAPLAVAWCRPADHSTEDARARFEEQAFQRACAQAPSGSLFASSAESDLSQLFGEGAERSALLKAGEQRAVLAVRSGGPKAQESILVPDPNGGAEHKVIVYEKGSEQFASRLSKVARQRRKWARKNNVTCYRVYDRDLPEYSCSVDVYGGAGDNSGATYVQVAEYQAPKTVDAATAYRRFADVLAIVPVVLGVRPDHVFSKVRSHGKGGSQYANRDRRGYAAVTAEEALLPANRPLAAALRKEGLDVVVSSAEKREECLFKVDFGSYLDTGLFLDHRLTRQMVASLAAGKTFLNLFAYTGTASVHAAMGGARETTTVDLSQTYLDWAMENFRLNGLEVPAAERSFASLRMTKGKADALSSRPEARKGIPSLSSRPEARSAGVERSRGGRPTSSNQFVRGDVTAWITEARRGGRKFDLIFVDPPTFSNSKAMGSRTWDVQRDHVELLIGVSRLLAKGGLAVFSCNLKGFKLAAEELERYGVEARDITALTIPEDFERTPKVHHCFLIRRIPVSAQS